MEKKKNPGNLPKSNFTSVKNYFAGFPKDTQEKLKQLRQIILELAPGAEEVISYQMPAYKLKGMLVWFAGYKNHIGFYPKSAAIEIFKKEISNFKSSKGAIQFPLDQPLPVGLITKIIKFRLKENLEAEKAKMILTKAKKKTTKK